MPESLKNSEEELNTTDALTIIKKTTTEERVRQPFAVPRLDLLRDMSSAPDEIETREFPTIPSSSPHSSMLDEILGDLPENAVKHRQNTVQHIDHAEQFKPHPVKLNVPEIADVTTSEALPALHGTNRSRLAQPIDSAAPFPESQGLSSEILESENVSENEDDYTEPYMPTGEFLSSRHIDTATAEFERTHATRPRRPEHSALEDPYFGLSEETIAHLKAAENISAGFEPAPAAENTPDAPTAEIPVQAKQ